MNDRAFQMLEKLWRRFGGHRADHAAGHQETECMDRIAGIGHQHHVAGCGDRLRHVGEAFLGAQGRDDLGLRVELHAEAALVIGCLGPAKTDNTLGGRIAIGAWLAKRLLELLDHMLGRRQVRIAHAEVDDIGSRIARGRLGPVDLFEHVRRQSANTVEFFHGTKALIEGSGTGI